MYTHTHPFKWGSNNNKATYTIQSVWSSFADWRAHAWGITAKHTDTLFVWSGLVSGPVGGSGKYQMIWKKRRTLTSKQIDWCGYHFRTHLLLLLLLLLCPYSPLLLLSSYMAGYNIFWGVGLDDSCGLWWVQSSRYHTHVSLQTVLVWYAHHQSQSRRK